MSSDRARRLAAIALLPLVASCASVPPITEQDGDAPFGEANRQTMMAQVVNPDPVYDEPAVTSGDHAAQAIERYRTDAVKEPESVSSTAGISAGSGGD
jgi:type IV pilus biogenesis protein CpaD/CtpE